MTNRTWSTLNALGLALALSACSQYPVMPTTPPGQAADPTSPGLALNLSSAGNIAVRGIVRAPASVVAAGGGNVVAAGGANVVAAGGGNVVAAGGGNFASSRRIASLQSEVPVAGARVALTDLAGAELAGYAAVTTDAEGRYTFPSVPASGLYMVVASFQSSQGEAIALRTLGRAGEDAAIQDVSVASTLVTSALKAQAEATNTFESTTFQAIVDAVAGRLEEADVAALARPETLEAAAKVVVARAGQETAIAEFSTKAAEKVAEKAAEKAAEPAIAQPAAPAAEQPKDEKPNDDKANEEKPKDDKAQDDKPAPDSTGSVSAAVGLSIGGSVTIASESSGSGSSGGGGGTSAATGSSGSAGPSGGPNAKDQEKAEQDAKKAADKAAADAKKAAEEKAKADAKAAAEAKKQAEEQAKAADKPAKDADKPAKDDKKDKK